jgi:hypothetical protein
MAFADLKRRINLFLAAALALNLALWTGSHKLYARWAGVPPVPSKPGAAMMTLGDPELSYRTGALTLQNLGDSGGQVTPLEAYDYAALGRWLDLLDDLDPASEHLPAVAAYYFGMVRDKPESTAVIVRYLTKVGRRPVDDKWRWLTQAAFLAQHRMKDLHLALDIAYTLSKMRPADGRELPAFAREYPAFILREQGEKDAARRLMEEQLLIEQNPGEVNYIKSFLIEQIGVDPAEVEAIMKRRGWK